MHRNEEVLEQLRNTHGQTINCPKVKFLWIPIIASTRVKYFCASLNIYLIERESLLENQYK